MASLRKKSGRYYARFYDKRRSPKRKEVALGCSRKDVARRRLSEWERLYREGSFDPWQPVGSGPERLTVEDAIARFMKSRSHLRPRTQDTYEGILRRWRETLPPGLLLTDVTASHLRPYVHASRLANATQRKRYGHVQTFLKWCVEQRHAQSNALEDVREPKEQKKAAAFLSTDDVETLLRTIDAHHEITEDIAGRKPDDDWLKAVIRVGVCTGLRRGELCRLRWRDVDLGQGFLTVRSEEGAETKSGHERRLPLRGDALDVLRKLNKERSDALTGGPVFTDSKGRSIKPGRASRRFKFFVRKAKLPDRERLRLHSLRHTCGSWLAMQGVPMKAIQAILGHSTMQITSETYSHVHDDVLVKAMEETFG
jgi:integrase